MRYRFLSVFAFCFTFLACQSQRQIPLSTGLALHRSCAILPDTFRLAHPDTLRPVIVIEGENLIVDFQGAVLDGSGPNDRPDEFAGTGILLKGKNITLKNAKVRGFKTAILAEGVDSLRLLDCDLSYNWRPRLLSSREKEDERDWLSFHHNDQDEWRRYGAAIYLKQCDHALVRGVTATGGMNALMLAQCNDGLFYNNSFRFNSGVGIGLYRSSRNRVLHNRLDWNVRGASWGFYQRGQDSAAILVYEQSNNNTFAYNSATHSGDGFFLWAGQYTMDSGLGGCNDNLLFRNDFSHAPTNGVEVTFSRNKIVANRLDDCNYGVWGGYSFESLFLANHIEGCRYGIAIEHGQHNAVVGNEFRHDTIGLQLWARGEQPADWGYAQKRDVHSMGYDIRTNLFQSVKNPLRISASSQVAINDHNLFEGFDKLLVTEKTNDKFYFVKNKVLGAQGWQDAAPFKGMNHLVSDKLPDFQLPTGQLEEWKPDPMPDALDVSLPANQLRGRSYILMHEWGPYDFQSPSIWLRRVEGDQYTFLLLGPPTGNWKAVGGTGWSRLSQKTGAFPATIVATKKEGELRVSLELEFIGEAFTDRFGRPNKRGKVFPFGFSQEVAQ